GAVAGLLEVRHLYLKASTRIGRIAGRAHRHYLSMVVQDKRVFHSQRAEDVLFGEFGERFSARPFDDDREQKISAVAVKPFVSWHEVQRLLPRDYVERVFFRGSVVEVHPGQREERQVIA